MFLTHIIPPQTPLTKILMGTTVDNNAAIAFYAHLGEDPKNYLNTPVVTYSLGNVNSLKVDPNIAVINDNVWFHVKVNHNSLESNDIVLKFGS